MHQLHSNTGMEKSHKNQGKQSQYSCWHLGPSWLHEQTIHISRLEFYLPARLRLGLFPCPSILISLTHLALAICVLWSQGLVVITEQKPSIKKPKQSKRKTTKQTFLQEKKKLGAKVTSLRRCVFMGTI